MFSSLSGRSASLWVTALLSQEWDSWCYGELNAENCHQVPISHLLGWQSCKQRAQRVIGCWPVFTGDRNLLSAMRVSVCVVQLQVCLGLLRPCCFIQLALPFSGLPFPRISNLRTCLAPGSSSGSFAFSLLDHREELLKQVTDSSECYVPRMPCFKKTQQTGS